MEEEVGSEEATQETREACSENPETLFEIAEEETVEEVISGPVHFVPYGSFKTTCGFTARYDKRTLHTDLRHKTTCDVCIKLFRG